ncbi:MAG: diphosphomevalonate decarboxylase, partial [Anaerolineales bacterium]
MLTNYSATAIAHPNIALIKYWGNQDEVLHIPSADSISMNLGSLITKTQVILDPDLNQDILILNNQLADHRVTHRVQQFLDYFRNHSEIKTYCRIISENNFPTAAGIASSASAFAALTLAAAKVFQLNLEPIELSRVARLGSGSACRSIPAGFVYWHAGNDHSSSYADSFAPPDY